MIAVDTSALMAIVFGEPTAGACIAALEAEDELLISAASVAEALIVALRRNVAQETERLIDGLSLQVVNVTPATSRRVAAVYAIWGKGMHRAALNLGDCFAYDVAKEHGCPLLYIGEDFAKTDVAGVLAVD